MSAPVNDGGPAFPCWDMQAVHAVAAAAVVGIADAEEREQAYVKARGGAVGGMSLRAHYAGLAMQGLMAQGWDIEGGVPCAVASADALIRALEAPPAPAPEPVVKVPTIEDLPISERQALRWLVRWADFSNLPESIRLAATACKLKFEADDDEVPF